MPRKRLTESSVKRMKHTGSGANARKVADLLNRLADRQEAGAQ